MWFRLLRIGLNLALVGALCACSNQNEGVAPRVDDEAGTVVYKDNVRFMEDVEGYRGVDMTTDVQGNASFIFDFAKPSRVGLHVGDIIIGRRQQPYYFHRVVSLEVVEQLRGRWVLLVEAVPASIEEAVERAEILTFVPVVREAKADGLTDEFVIPVVDLSDITLYERFDGNGTGARIATLPESKVELVGGYEIEIRINDTERYFKLAFHGGLTAALALEGEATVDIDIHIDEITTVFPPLNGWSQMSLFTLGGIPINVKGRVDAVLTARFQGQASFQVGYALEQTSGFSMELTEGQWTYGLDDNVTTSELTRELDMTVDKPASLMVGLKPYLAVGVGGGAFGARLHAEAGFSMFPRLQVDALGPSELMNPEERDLSYLVESCLDIDLFAGGQFHLFFLNLEHSWDHGLYHNCWRLAEGQLANKPPVELPNAEQ
jgi:hypothetical protein